MNNKKCKNHYLSPRWTGEILDCSMPMTFDTYSHCSFGCLYCFSFFQKSVNTGKIINYMSDDVTHVSVEKVKKMFMLQSKGEADKQFFPYIKNRLYMQWGGLSDQFDYYEKRYGITLELMKFFSSIKYPLSFSTKSTWFVDDDRYAKLIRGKDNWHFKISIINLDEDKAKLMERGVSSPMKRLDTIKKLSDLGVDVTLRLRPFIIGYTDKDDEYIELIKLAKENGASSVSTEFLCLDSRMPKKLIGRYDEINRLVGYNIYDFYKRFSTRGGYLRLNKKIKKKYIEKMDKLCKDLGMRFYVSDADFKERCNNGCCCGMDATQNYSKGQFTEALLIAKQNGYVYWKDIEEVVKLIHSKYHWWKATGFNTAGTVKRIKYKNLTMYDYIKFMWNSPNKSGSPYKYFGGILKPVKKDLDGNIVYKYTG